MTPEQIASACDGDDGALEHLVAHILPALRQEVTHALFRRARLHGRDAGQDVDDFVQEVMVYLLADDGHRLRSWDPARGRSLRSFVRLLARHRISRILEGFRGNPWEGGAAEDPQLADSQATEPEEAFARALSRQQLERLMDQLRARFSERSLLLFELLYVEQRSVAEVCEQLDMTRSAVDQWNVRLRRLVRQMAEQLDRAPRGTDARGRTVGR